MSNFGPAINVVLRHEGGWVNNPHDAGAETNFGISTLIIRRENISAQELGIDPATMFKPDYLKPMKVEAAQMIYKRLFWDKYGYQDLNDQTVATKIFDCGVNCGPGRAHVMAQVAANNCGQKLIPDGILGPASRVGINSCDPQTFVLKMKEQMEIYYKGLVAARPDQSIFLSNWLRRAAWIG